MQEILHIPFNVPLQTGREIELIEQVLGRQQFSGDGFFTKNCQSQLEAITGTARALLTPSCTHALELAALLCQIGPDDEVILPSFTFVSTANAFALRGARLVFVDIDPQSMNLDPAAVEAALTPKTKAIVFMHYAGFGQGIEAVAELAQHHGLFLIEDAAHCIGATQNGKALGTFGQLGTLSFHQTKNIQCGEGGALLINDPDLIARAEILREKGTNRKAFLLGQVDQYSWVDLGSSYLPGELNAAFLAAQLPEYERVSRHRKTLWQLYHQYLRPLASTGQIGLPPSGSNEHNGHIFFVKCRDQSERSSLTDYLLERGIHAHFHYVPLHSAAAGQQFGQFKGPDLHTTRESERLLRLPLYFELSPEQIHYICQTIEAFYE